MTPADVVLWGKLPTLAGDDLTLMAEVVEATEAMLVRDYGLPWVLDTEGVAVVPAELLAEDLALCELAIKMQAVRLWKRRETPEGISNFGTDFGPLRVVKFDPDVERLVGGWARFPVG